MVETADFVGLIGTGSLLVVVLVISSELLHVALVGLMVVISAINAAPYPSGNEQRYAITGVTILGLLLLLPSFVADPVSLILLVGGVVGLTLLAVKGPDFRWSAIGILSLAVLISAGLAVLSGRTVTAIALVTIDVVGLVSARGYWRTR